MDSLDHKIIGRFVGSEPGPLLLITAAMHGNEPAGVEALKMLFATLVTTTEINPAFNYKGVILGVIGNLEAFKVKKRFIQKDINRCWDEDYIISIQQTTRTNLKDEDLEIKLLLEIIEHEIKTSRPEKIYLLDLHTTSSAGGVFSITTFDNESITIANELHAPVVLGLLRDVKGTTLHFFNNNNIGVPAVAIGFEGGQHENPISVQRCLGAVINFMKIIGTICKDFIEARADYLLEDSYLDQPQVVNVVYKYHVDDNKIFSMKPGYANFQHVHKGEHLADYDGHPVLSPLDGRILMPLYQSQGNDGFFVTEDVLDQ